MSVRLQTLTKDRSPEELAYSPDKKTWSAQEILAHLRAYADLWTHSIYAMLAELEPVLPDIDERKYTRAARYAEVPFREAVDVFSMQRANLMLVLQETKPDDRERGPLSWDAGIQSFPRLAVWRSTKPSTANNWQNCNSSPSGNISHPFSSCQ